MTNNETKEQKNFFAEHYYATIEELEKALKDKKLKELYDKTFEEESEKDNSSIKR